MRCCLETFCHSSLLTAIAAAVASSRSKVEGCWLQLLQQGSITQQELSALSAAAN
jgi:hypothetical protein